MQIRLIALIIAAAPLLSSAQSQQDMIDSLIAINKRLTDQLRMQVEQAEVNRQLALINADSARAAAMKAEMNAHRAVAAEQESAEENFRQNTMLSLYIDSTAYYRLQARNQLLLAKREMFSAKLHVEELKWDHRKKLEELEENTPEPIEVTQQRDSLKFYELRKAQVLIEIDSIRMRLDTTNQLLRN